MKKCSRCGSEFADLDFCGKCGAKLESSIPPESEQAQAVPVSQINSVPRNKGRANKAIAIACASLIAVGFLFFALGGAEEQKLGKTGGAPSAEKAVQKAECNHEWNPPTCTAPSVCKKCLATKPDSSALGGEHQVDEWEVVKEPTCSEAGARRGVCVKCGFEVTELPKLEHEPGDWETISKPHFDELGESVPGAKARKCKICGETVESKEVPVKEEATVSQKNAIRVAHSYLDFMAFSKKGLIDQLEYEGFSTEDAEFAAKRCGADWNEQAEKCAENYLKTQGFSRDGLIDQLEYEGFTHKQAVHGVDAVGL